MTEDIVASHVGLCVSDLDRSLRFYCEGLGFTKGDTYPIYNTFALTPSRCPATWSAPPSSFARRASPSTSHYESPGADGQPSQRRNQIGLTHLSFYVGDVDRVAASLVALGGTVQDSTHTKADGIEILFPADPDGARVELMKAG